MPASVTQLLRISGYAFLIALVVTPILRDIFRAYNVVDRPGLRKVHAYPIPRLGGIALAAAYSMALAGQHVYALLWKLLPGAGLMFATGILDDFFNLRARYKLAAQIAAGCLAWRMGLRAPGPDAISLPLTVFWLVLAANAFNLIDGLDGLCAGLGCIGATVLFLLGWMQSDLALQRATLPLAAALLGFLCFNFSRATMFLGDSGALLIGFLLGCAGLIWSADVGRHVRVVAPVLAVAVPLMDVALAVVRRVITRRPIFAPDRAHTHHRLLDRGLNPTHVTLLLYAWGICGGVFAWLLAFPALESWRWTVVAVFAAAMLLGISQLKYSEFKWRHN